MEGGGNLAADLGAVLKRTCMSTDYVWAFLINSSIHILTPAGGLFVAIYRSVVDEHGGGGELVFSFLIVWGLVLGAAITNRLVSRVPPVPKG